VFCCAKTGQKRPRWAARADGGAIMRTAFIGKQIHTKMVEEWRQQ
jgi:hypothetical protein